MITQNATIFERVCPLDQTYDQRYYAGIDFPLSMLVENDVVLIFSSRNISFPILAIR